MDPHSAPRHAEASPHSPHEAADGRGLEHAALLAEAALRLAQRLREGGLDDMAEEAGSMARSSPLAFLGGSMLIGFAMARFFKATAERRHSAASTPF